MVLVATLAQGCTSDGICLQGKYRALTGGPPAAQEQLDLQTIIEKRLSAFGVPNRTVRTEGSDGIIVGFPVVTNEADVRRLIAQRGKFAIFGVPPTSSSDVQPFLRVPPGLLLLLDGGQLASAASSLTQTGQWGLDLTLKDDAARSLDEYAASHLGEQLAVALDGIVLSAPVIQATNFGGRAQVSSGTWRESDVNALVAVLTYGPLPFDIEEVSFERLCAADASRLVPS